MCSIAASMATMAFNREFRKAMDEDPTIPSTRYNWYLAKINNGAMFDARCFNIPKEEVTNLIYWRQLDATRNSIQMVGQANFSHSELQNKSCNMIQDMLFQERNINWNDYPTHLKRGSCCVHKPAVYAKSVNDQVITWNNERTEWVIDTEIPIFKGEGREYIEKLIQPEED